MAEDEVGRARGREKRREKLASSCCPLSCSSSPIRTSSSSVHCEEQEAAAAEEEAEAEAEAAAARRGGGGQAKKEKEKEKEKEKGKIEKNPRRDGERGGGGVLDSPDTIRSRISLTTQLFWHTRNNDADAVSRLLQQDPELVSALDYDSRTALHVAAFNGCLQAAAVLLDHHAPINAQDRWGNSPLADAENGGHVKLVELLMSRGGRILGSHGLQLDGKDAIPPLPQRCDWEIDPDEIDFSTSVIIGKGSFGEIRKAFWRGTPVAVKRILPSLSDDRLIIEDFKSEVNLLVKLRHPNVVQFLGAVTLRRPLLLVTEYLHSGDLHAYMKGKGGLSALLAVNFALDIAQGMTYLHKEPNVIIHRDLKPRNVLLVENQHLKVGDFGLSKLIKVKSLHEVYKLTGETGSYRYMAPEVFLHKEYDMKVDVFSFGMILYEMFEGVRPFHIIEPYAAAKAVSKGERPEMNAKTYPPYMKELIKNCWNHEKAFRPTFIEIVVVLEKMKAELNKYV